MDGLGLSNNRKQLWNMVKL